MISEQELMNAKEHTAILLKQYWHEQVVNTPQWWFLLISLILPWIVWFFLVDRNRLLPITFVGLFFMFVSSFLDQLGNSLNYWRYSYMLTPLEKEELIPTNLALIPVVYMFLYQYLKKWKSYIIGSLCIALFNSYIGGIVFTWFGIYHLLEWKYIFSVPIYFVLALLAKYIVDTFQRLHQTAGPKE
ncbi:CBO0543 family protein [Radiobacillus deserti]|uniref:ABC transporter permease n=1 Tax=Radiobacillus deserti TaxID=2594883 RepID=A0A516KFX7_9BACI|nr:CBO0543 family protein [Radiobacillus deserti]QDP40280.1 hypothetical protein FN924_08895 [Radiobacillus deserti]